MEQQIMAVRSTRVCGVLQNDPTCICLRATSHWGPHVIQNAWGEFYLAQTACMPITFRIEAAVAHKAIDDPAWVWEG